MPELSNCTWPTEGESLHWDCHTKEKPVTRYTELRHAGYYAPNLNDKERQAIADKVDGAPTRTATPKGSTTSQDVAKVAKSTKAAKSK